MVTAPTPVAAALTPVPAPVKGTVMPMENYVSPKDPPMGIDRNLNSKGEDGKLSAGVPLTTAGLPVAMSPVVSPVILPVTGMVSHTMESLLSKGCVPT